MEIIKNFGVDPVLLVAQIVNFLVILFILKKYLYKPILDILNKRQNAVEEGIRNAEDARIKLEKAVIEEKNILKEAQAAAKKIIEDARDDAITSVKKVQED